MSEEPNVIAVRTFARLRKGGFDVRNVAMPPRPWSATSFKPNAVLLHHTASSSNTNEANELADVRYIKHVPWGGPGAQWYVGRTGTIYMICKGGANHAGTGNELTQYGIPVDQGNYRMWGIEVQSAGLKMDWTRKQWKAVHWLTACLLLEMGQDSPGRVWRHKDYDNDSGKVDTVYPLSEHRAAVRSAMKEIAKQDRLLKRRGMLKRQLAKVRELLRRF